MKIDVMGVQFDNVTMDEALSSAISLLPARRGGLCGDAQFRNCL